jgi:hypothetical protein
MPRYKLANNDEIWNILSSVCSLHPEVKRKAIELLKLSTTRFKLYERIVKLNYGQQDFDWNTLFDRENEWYLLYAL